MAYTGKEAVFQLSSILAGKGVEVAVLSPGSRNAPLIAAFSRQAGIRSLSIVDERAAAFFALGIAQQSRKPVALVCTSGTALLNYAPAIAEAYYQQLPLIVVSADRAPEWIDQGDGQAIRQAGVFQLFTRAGVNLPVDPLTDSDLRYHARLVHQAVDRASYPVPGPVHINVGLREPLYQNLAPGTQQLPWHAILGGKMVLEDHELGFIADQWNHASNKMVIIGQMPPCHELDNLLEKLADDPSVVVLTETTSNQNNDRYLTHIDRLIDGLSRETTSSLRPEILLTMGGHIVSRKIKAWLQQNPAREHWHMDRADFHLDTFRALSLSILSTPLDFLNGFLPRVERRESSYAARWQQQASSRDQKHQEYLNPCGWSDLKAFDIICAHIPEGYFIQAGNSTPIRYLQLFKQPAHTWCFGNRGTSGIDGVVSTAAGAAWANPAPCLLICGDLSLFYDSNGLWHQHLTPNLRIIVMNNGGGNIFRIIEGPDTLPELETYIETPHVPGAHHLAMMHGIAFQRADDEPSLRAILPGFLQASNEGPAMLEIVTPNKASASVLRSYFKFLAK